MSEIITLCCGRGKCPTIEKTSYGFEIKDDFGGTVKLTAKEIKMLYNRSHDL